MTGVSYRRELEPTEIQRIEGLFMWSMPGLSPELLPEDHPYRHAPPTEGMPEGAEQL